MKKLFFRLRWQPALLLLFLAMAARAGITEPDTIFYGQIINRTSGQAEYVNSGTIVWVVSSATGQQVTVTNTLQSLNNGQYCYQLAVPQEAFGFGLTAPSDAIPLPPQPTGCTNVQITVNGFPASIMAPGSDIFMVSQTNRSATYRLDLELTNPLSDANGDGLPDWWKALYGITDPNADPLGDGWSNLQKFLNGLNPNQDSRFPTLTTPEIYVYADGTTGIHLDVVSSLTGPTGIVYSLTSLPAGGTLYLRNAVANPSTPDAALTIGSSFTQDDVNNGRLVFVYAATGSPAMPTQFSFNLTCGNPTFATNGTVTLDVYRPVYPNPIPQIAAADAAAPVGFTDIAGLSFYEQQMLIDYYLSHNQGYVVWDVSRAAAPQQILVPSSGMSASQYSQYVASYGHDRQYVMVGGEGNDHLVGGMENDIIVAGHGVDSMRGNGGSDLFIIPAENSGADTIEDFSTNDNDVIDISRVLTGTSGWLTNYAQLTNDGTNSYLALNSAGAGLGFTNMVLTLSNTTFTASDLRTLVDNGNLLTGGRVVTPMITVAATIPNASENGPLSGQFTFTRSGGMSSALTINLQMSGSAINGQDYQLIPAQVTFAVGQRTVTVPVNPYTTGAQFTNVVQASILSSANYLVGSSSLAQVTIAPLAPQISIEALEPLATRNDGTPAVFLLSREGITANSVLVRLSIAGTAVNGVDYASVPAFVNLSPQQTTVLIYVTPKPGATPPTPDKYVQISVTPNSSYVLMNPTADRVYIADEMLTGSVWQQENASGSSASWATFAGQDTGNTGIQNIYRYAFGLNFQNPQNSTGRPVAQLWNGDLVVSFREPLAVTDLSYVIQSSADLIHWSNASVQQVLPSLIPNDLEMVSFQTAAPITAGQKMFLRVVVVPQD